MKKVASIPRQKAWKILAGFNYAKGSAQARKRGRTLIGSPNGGKWVK
jgi:hypothetical protein